MAQTAQAQVAQTAVDQKLAAVDQQVLKAELGIDEGITDKPVSDPELEKKADEFVGRLLGIKNDDAAAQMDVKAAVENMGLDLQKKSSAQSRMLKEPVKKLSQRSEDGGEVANALIGLKIQVEDLDPSRMDFQAGWFTRLVGAIPGVGSPLKRYFSRYESAQTVISAIIRSLELGREQLKRDNVTLAEDQKRMRELTVKLKRAIALGQVIDQKITYSLERELAADEQRKKFVSEELLFPLRQRIMDLQQQLAVNQQGVLSTELIIRNNQELVRGVNRALNVTVSALEVAVTVAMALADQKIVLDKINAISATTNSLIAGTAERLKTQGAEIHKQASTTQLDMEVLKNAFKDIKIAMDDISQFRLNALPQMADAILQMDRLNTQAEDKIKEMEESNSKRSSLSLDVD
ncbi:MAG: toxic anion resistance protein [Deltaproteobacteria bacterium]|nr:toxic anion resistance protein [Deltaproteobacteria bacterium]